VSPNRAPLADNHRKAPDHRLAIGESENDVQVPVAGHREFEGNTIDTVKAVLRMARYRDHAGMTHIALDSELRAINRLAGCILQGHDNYGPAQRWLGRLSSQGHGIAVVARGRRSSPYTAAPSQENQRHQKSYETDCPA
jgi:hypothetical protein